MTKTKNLKNSNRKWLISYMFLHFVIFAIAAAVVNPTFDDISSLLAKLKSPSGLIPLIIFPLSVVLEGLIHSNRKAVLVFWRIRNPLPGCRAFSKIAPNDPRIDMAAIKKIYPDGLPSDPKEQNAAWYKLYKQYEDKMIVNDAHRFFLLTRDLAALTVVLIPFCVVAHLFWQTPAATIGYHVLVLTVVAALICLSAQSYGKRLVENVFAEAIT